MCCKGLLCPREGRRCHTDAVSGELGGTGIAPAQGEVAPVQVGRPGGPALVLFGFMGAGKTTVGRCVARRLGVAFTDADHVIVAEQGRSIQQIFADDGEAAFREIEHEVIGRLLGEQDGVLALGGGAVMHPGTQQLLRAHPMTVHLKVTLEHTLARCGDDPSRPMLRRPDLAEIHARRMEVYDRVATLIQITDGLDGTHVCGEVLRAVERCWAGSATQL